jgi:hypothetical protein
LAEKQHDIAELERQTSHIQTFQPSMMPGLLQTAEYARRMLSASFNVTPADIQARIERSAVLYDESKRFDFLLTEWVLSWRPGGLNLAAQLSHVRSIATLPNVNIHVVRGSDVPALHPFVIWDGRLVTVETYHAELQTDDVERYQEVWQQLSTGAQDLA